MTQVLLCLCGVFLVPFNSFVDSAQVLLASFCYRLSPFGAGGLGGGSDKLKITLLHWIGMSMLRISEKERNGL